MSKEFEALVSVDDNGGLVFIYDDSLAFLKKLGTPSISRASHVEPTEDGQWTATMEDENQTVLGPFELRQEALDAEVAFLRERLF